MFSNKELLKGSTAMMILSLLSNGEQYGYQMIKTLEAMSDNTFTFKEGTLYPLLHELENKGFAESFYEETDSPRKRKYYRITREGRKVLEAKKQEWSVFSGAVNKVLGGMPDERHAF